MEEEEEEKRGTVNPAALFAASVRNLLALGSVSNWDTVYGSVTRHQSPVPVPFPLSISTSISFTVACRITFKNSHVRNTRLARVEGGEAAN